MSSSNTRDYSRATRAMLWAHSGDVCCFPECEVRCVDETESGKTITIGQIAHIEAESDNGPRANPSLSDQQRNAYPNLIVLCPNHHRIVDADESTYTVEKMREWKAHRARVAKAATSKQGTESIDSSELTEGVPQSASGLVLEQEPREASLHRETRDAIVGQLSSEIAKLHSMIADLGATDGHSQESPRTDLDPQYTALSAKVDVARNLINRGLVSAARLELEELNKNAEMPDDLKFRIITNLGACALAVGEFENARTRLLEAYELQPDSQKGIVNAALAAQLDDDSKRAMELARQARELDSKDSQATAILLKELWDAGHTEEFEELIDTEEWVTRDKQCAMDLATIRMQESRFGEAVALCRFLIEADAKNAQSHLTLCECLIRQAQAEIRTLGFTNEPIGKLREAVESATMALEILPSDFVEQRQATLVSRACAHAMLDEMDDAIRDLDNELVNIPSQLDAINVNKGLVLLQVGRPYQARAAFKEIQDSELRSEIVLPLAEACLASGDARTAIDLIDGSFSLEEPTWEDVLKATALARAEQALGIEDSIGPVLASNLEHRPNDPRLLTLTSIHSSVLGSPENAEDSLIEALRHASTNDREMILTELGILYLNLGRFSEAADAYTEIVGDVATHPNALSLLYCLAKSDRLRETLNWARKIRQARTVPPRVVIETEAYVLEQIGDARMTASLRKELCSRTDSTPLDSVFLAMAQLRCGDRNSAKETIRGIQAIELREHPWAISTLSKMKLALGIPDFLDDAYLALRCGFNDREIHKNYVELFLSRGEDIPEPEYVGPGCAVLLKGDSEQWWDILDEGEEPDNRFELSPGDDLAQRVLGRRAGETVTLRRGPDELSYEIVGIQSKFVRKFQEIIEVFPTRFPSDTSLSTIKIGENDISNLLSIVDQRDALVRKAEKAYVEGYLPLSTFASLIGRSTLEVWLDCTKRGAARIRFSDGSDEEFGKSLQLLHEADSVVLDMTALLTAYELGLGGHLRSRFTQVSVPQHVIDELRQSHFDLSRNFSRAGYLNKGVGGGYEMTEISDDALMERPAYVHSVLEFAEPFAKLPAYRLLETDDYEHLAETLTHAGAGAVFARNEQPSARHLLISDDLGLSNVARSFGTDSVNTLALLDDLLRVEIITGEEYSSYIENLVMLNYWFVRVTSEDIVRRLGVNGYMTSEGTRAMLKTLEAPDCSEDSAVSVGAGVIVALSGNVPYEQLELILAAVIESLKQARNAGTVLRKFRKELAERLTLTPHWRMQILQSVDLYIRM